MRELKLIDSITLARILNNANEDIKLKKGIASAIGDLSSDEATQEQSFIDMIFAGLPILAVEKNENLIVELLSSISGKAKEEVEEMPLDDIVQLIIDIYKSNQKLFTRFFNGAGK